MLLYKPGWIPQAEVSIEDVLILGQTLIPPLWIHYSAATEKKVGHYSAMLT